MNKLEFIERYGEAAYNKMLKRNTEWQKQNPEIVERASKEQKRKGGKYYDKKLIYERTGLQGERNKVRRLHRHLWCHYKNLIAPESQIHHQWVPRTSEYIGVALVEKDQHMHGYIDVIEILEGEISLFVEENIRRQ